MCIPCKKKRGWARLEAEDMPAEPNDISARCPRAEAAAPVFAPVPVQAPAPKAVLVVGDVPVFPTVPLGDAAPDQIVTISNTGQAPLTVTDVRTTGAIFSRPDPWAAQDIPPGESRTVKIHAVPNSATARQTGTVEVVTSEATVTKPLVASAYDLVSLAAQKPTISPGIDDAGLRYVINDPEGVVGKATITIHEIDAGTIGRAIATFAGLAHAAGENTFAWLGKVDDTSYRRRDDAVSFITKRKSPYRVKVTIARADDSGPLEKTCDVCVADTGELTVRIQRSDGKALSKQAKLRLTPVSPGRPSEYVTTAKAGSPACDEVVIKGLARADYTVAIIGTDDDSATDLAAYLTAQGAPGTWRVAPDENGTVHATVKADERATATFQLSCYKQVQFVGLHATPTGTNRTTGNLATLATYKGEPDDEQDMLARCEIMKAAMAAAEANRAQVPLDPNVLKVFMAPEFFFRGQGGGYPLDLIERIPATLVEEARQAKYADWIFVYGTAIGYLKHGDAPPVRFSLTITQAPAGNPQTVRVTAGTSVSGSKPDVCERIPPGRVAPGQWQLDQNGIRSGIRIARPVPSSTDYELELVAGVPAVVPGAVELVAPLTFSLEIVHVAGNVVRVKEGAGLSGAKVGICARVPADRKPIVQWRLHQDGNAACIDRAVRLSATEYELHLASGSPTLNQGPVDLEEPPTTEIFNVAFVQRGGPSPGGQRDLLVYKDYLSAIDFFGRQHKDVLNHFYNSDGEHVADIHGTERFLMPMMGSVDGFSVDRNSIAKNAISEQNDSGLGGGSLFTMAGVNFGLEVCLDHRMGRLWTYGQNSTTGDCVPQIHLIPSWGMSIGEGPVYAVTDGLAFNVDGQVSQRPDASVFGGSNRCPDHAHQSTLISTPGRATCSQPHAKCTRHRHMQTAAGPCIRCGNPTQLGAVCGAVHFPSGPVCSCGATGLPRLHYCDYCGNPNIGGPCCPGYAQIPAYRCPAGHLQDAAGACTLYMGCSEVAVEAYLCTTPHFVTGAICPDCGGPTTPTHKCSAQHDHTEHVAGGSCQVCQRTLQAEGRKLGPLQTPVPATGPTPVADPSPVNEQSKVTRTVVKDVRTGDIISDTTTRQPPDQPPIELPLSPPTTDTVAGAARTRTWVTGALTLTSVEETDTTTAGDKRTETTKVTTSRRGTVHAEHSRLFAQQTALYVFPARDLPPAKTAT